MRYDTLQNVIVGLLRADLDEALRVLHAKNVKQHEAEIARVRATLVAVRQFEGRLVDPKARTEILAKATQIQSILNTFSP